jgi:hypothetical protein
MFLSFGSVEDVRRLMDRNRNARDNGAFNAHTGAAFGLIIGIILGSLLLNVPGIAA